VIRIAVCQAAPDAIADALPSAASHQKDERLLRVETAVADKLTAMLGPGESYSDVILRLVEIEARP
jgi:hypothetical protein